MSVSVKQRPRKSQEQRTRIFKKTTTAADRLRSDIRDGVFKPGQWVNKEKVGRGYGVGITSMETACQALVKEGLLEARKWQSRTTYYVPEPKPTLESVPASLLAEARASVALDGETRSLEATPTRLHATSRRTLPEVAFDMLRQDLAEGKYPVGSVMPTQAELASALGTNPNAVWHAMTALKREGFVKSHSGQPAIVVALPSLPAKPTPTESAVTMAQSLSEEDEPTEKGVAVRQPPKEVTVRQYIIDRIQDGTYAPGTFMPSLQVMANSAGAGYQTIRYVYERLAKQGFLGKDSAGNWIVSQESEPLPSEPPSAEPPSAEPANPFANLIGFVTRLADIGATAELQRLWALEEAGLSQEAEAKLQADIADLRKDLEVAQGENRNLVSGITALREEKVHGVGQYKNLKETYIKLQEAHERVLAEYDQLRKVAQLIGSPTNGGGVSKLSVEAALRERKPLPARRGY